MRNATEAEIASDGFAAGPSGQREIAALAYQLWQDRGCPSGSPDEDWFHAEQELAATRETAAGAGGM